MGLADVGVGVEGGEEVGVEGGAEVEVLGEGGVPKTVMASF